MPEFTTPLTTDSDVVQWEPVLSGSARISDGISHMHEAASDDVARAIRTRWWPDMLRRYDSGQQVFSLPVSTRLNLNSFDPNKLSKTQLNRVACFLVLGKYLWPDLDAHNEEDTYPKKRAAHWMKRYAAEFDELMADGIAYDWDSDGTAEIPTEKEPATDGGGIRIDRG